MEDVKEYVVKIIDIRQITHNVKRFRFEKPKGYKYAPGQATEVSINKKEWEKEKRPFTFTCLNDEDFLEFTIKIYFDHKGLTNQIGKLEVGDFITIREPFGTIKYKEKGVFIAGGAGITPFIAIFRQLYKHNNLKGNKLIFSNNSEKDIILKEELEKMFGRDCLFILTKEKTRGFKYGFVNAEFLKSKINSFIQHFYICGPPQMVVDLKRILESFGAKVENIVFEE